MLYTPKLIYLGNECQIGTRPLQQSSSFLFHAFHMLEAAIGDHFTNMLQVRVRDFTLLCNPWPEKVDLDDIYTILISVQKTRNSVLTNPQDENAHIVFH
jgi:hypothetical protein